MLNIAFGHLYWGPLFQEITMSMAITASPLIPGGAECRKVNSSTMAGKSLAGVILLTHTSGIMEK